MKEYFSSRWIRPISSRDRPVCSAISFLSSWGFKWCRFPMETKRDTVSFDGSSCVEDGESEELVLEGVLLMDAEVEGTAVNELFPCCQFAFRADFFWG